MQAEQWQEFKPSPFVGEPEIVILRMQHGVMLNYNYVLIDSQSRDAVIVDPAWEMDKVDLALTQHCAQLKGILITHGHEDHINLAKAVSTKYGVPIWMSALEVSAWGFSAPNLVEIDETPFFVGDMEIQPILTPGHTPGCICYQVGDNLFTGDVLFAEGCGVVPNLAAAYDMFDSLSYLKNILDDSTRIYPGHSFALPPGQTFVNVMKHNMYLQFKDKDSFATFRLRKKQKKSQTLKFK